MGGASEQQICLAFASFKAGWPLHAGETIDRAGSTAASEHSQDRWRRGLPFPFVHRQWDTMQAHTRRYFRDQQPGFAWRDKNKFRAVADDIRRTLRLWRNSPATNPNRRWLAQMVKAIRICFSGLEEEAEQAASFAAEIGEIRYFEVMLRPIMTRYAKLRRADVERPDLPPLAQMLELIDPNRALAMNILPNDAE
jgi:hypothetical protein